MKRTGKLLHRCCSLTNDIFLNTSFIQSWLLERGGYEFAQGPKDLQETKALRPQLLLLRVSILLDICWMIFSVCKWSPSTGNESFPMCLTPPQPKRMTKGGLRMKVWTEGWTEDRTKGQSLLCLLCKEVGLNAACDWILTPVIQLG